MLLFYILNYNPYHYFRAQGECCANYECLLYGADYELPSILFVQLLDFVEFVLRLYVHHINVDHMNVDLHL